MRRIWTHMFVLAALFTGLTLFLLAPGSISWVDVLVTFVVGGGIYALALFWPVARRIHPESTGSGCGTLIWMMVMGVVGTVVAVVALGILEYPRGDWRPLPAPPEPAVEILDSAVYMVFGDEVWVRAVSGAVYSLGCGNNLSCEWEPRTEMPEPESQPDPSCDEGGASYHPPFKWGRSVDQEVKHFCGADYLVETHFRLMEDGTLWRWEIFRGMSTLFAPLGAMFAGFVLTLFVTMLYGVPRSSGKRATSDA